MNGAQFYGILVTVFLGILANLIILGALLRASAAEAKACADLAVQQADLHDAEIKARIEDLTAAFNAGLQEFVQRAHTAGLQGVPLVMPDAILPTPKAVPETFGAVPAPSPTSDEDPDKNPEDT